MDRSFTVDLLKALLGAVPRDQTVKAHLEVGGEPAHEDEACNCQACQLSRFELPLPPQGDELNRTIISVLKEVHESGENSAEAGQSTSVDLIVKPMPPDVERVLLQYRVDRSNACARAERALAMLLPEEKRPPLSYLHDEVTLEKALNVMVDARARTLAKFQQQKRAQQAVDAADDAAREAHAATSENPRNDSAA